MAVCHKKNQAQNTNVKEDTTVPRRVPARIVIVTHLLQYCEWLQGHRWFLATRCHKAILEDLSDVLINCRFWSRSKSITKPWTNTRLPNKLASSTAPCQPRYSAVNWRYLTCLLKSSKSLADQQMITINSYPCMKQEIRIFYLYACLSQERCQSVSLKKGGGGCWSNCKMAFRISFKT